MRQTMSALFFALAVLSPLIVVPIIAYQYKDWWILCGIAASYAGFLFAANRVKVAGVLPVIIGIGYWSANGFNVHQYFTFFLICFLFGFFCSVLSNAYENM